MANSRNPVTRTLVRTKCGDGVWRTVSAIALAVRSHIPDNSAVRYYIESHKDQEPPGADTDSKIRAAWRFCVRKVVSEMVRCEVMESDPRPGDTRYRIPSEVKNKKIKASDSDIEFIPRQTVPADTKTGVTINGFLAEIVAMGGEATADSLVEAMKNLFSPNLVQWYRGYATKSSSGSTGKKLKKLTDEQILIKAQYAAVDYLYYQSRHSHKTSRVVVTRYYFRPGSPV